MKKIAVMLALAAITTAVAGGDLWARESKKEKKKKEPARREKTEKTPRKEKEIRAVPSLTGETGYFNVYTADGLCARQLSVQGSYQNWDRDPGSVSETEFALSFGYGLTDKLEASVSLRAVELDIRHNPVTDPPAYYMGSPILGPSRETGTGNPRVGVKYNFLTEREGGRPGLAVMGYLELPRRDQDAFRGTGKTVYGATLVGTKRLGPVGASLNLGYKVFDPKENITGRYDINNQWTYGLGLRFPEGRRFQVIGEVQGWVLAENQDVSPSFNASFPMYPLGSDIPDRSRAYWQLGAQYQFKNGFTLGAAGRWTDMQDSSDTQNDGWGIIAKISWSSPCRTAPPPPPPPPTPGKVMDDRALGDARRQAQVEFKNLPPTVRIQPDATIAHAGESIRLRALGQDPEGQNLLYGWKPDRGTIVGSGDSIMWKAPEDCVEGPVIIRSRATDPEGLYGEDSITIQVVCPEEETAPMERVFFELDRDNLTPAGAAAVKRMVDYLRKHGRVTVIIEGHTCNLGTATYNLALGQRRAESVRREMVRLGIPAERLRAISYGLTRPAYSNDTEDTKRFNRRVDFVLQKKAGSGGH